LLRKEHLQKYTGLKTTLHQITNGKFQIVEVSNPTEGAACTALLAKDLINNDEEFVSMDSLISAKINYEDREMFMYPQNFIELKNKFYNSFHLKPYLKELLKDYHVNNIEGKVTLGVQVRLTYMKHYHNVSGINKYVDKINQILFVHLNQRHYRS
jgi:hypothetical protein